MSLPHRTDAAVARSWLLRGSTLGTLSFAVHGTVPRQPSRCGGAPFHEKSMNCVRKTWAQVLVGSNAVTRIRSSAACVVSTPGASTAPMNVSSGCRICQNHLSHAYVLFAGGG